MISIEQDGGATRATARLTKRAIDQAEPLSKPYFVWDGELKGFGARIDPGGAKTFAVRYRPRAHGASAPKRFITIGRYGALTVDEARNRAKEILVEIAVGQQSATCNRIRAVVCSLPRASLLAGARFGLLSRGFCGR